MARLFSSRPLTPGVTTIWYRAPELLLGSDSYSSSVDMWSAGLIVAELLLSEALLMGDTTLSQLSRTVKLLGTPTADDLASLSRLGCSDLIHWEHNEMASGRPENLRRRFDGCRLGSATEPTARLLKGMLTWDPKLRWTAPEALGKSRGAREWWEGNPKACDSRMLANFLAKKQHSQASDMDVNEEGAKAPDRDYGKSNVEYVFDFDDRARSTKRSRKE